MGGAQGWGGVLDPIDRLSEVMFGLLMALTFTGTMSVALGAGATVREILLAALGCNIAWGIVDATVHVLTTVTERSRDRAQAARIRAAPEAEAQRLLRALLPGHTGEVLSPDEAASLVAWMRRHPPEPARSLTRADAGAAATVFLLVSGATFPPILPFLLVTEVPLAMRLSNAVAVLMLAVIGWRLDREMQNGSRVMRYAIPVIGMAMVAVTIALGG